MKRALVAFTVLLFVAPVLAQRPSDPALLVPETAPELDYVVGPTPITVPAGMTMGASASVAFDANGHVIVLTRGDKAFFEFDRDGTFVRAFGEKLFTRAHGLRIDRDDDRLPPVTDQTGELLLGDERGCGYGHHAIGLEALRIDHDHPDEVCVG